MKNDSVTLNETTNREKDETIKKLVVAAIFAALSYVVFTFLAIRVPTPGGQVSIHLGNAVLALGALLLGAKYGAAGGAIGLTISDLIDPVYIVEAPATFFIKLLIGIIIGLIAHNIGHISTETDKKKVLFWTIIAVTAGMAFNAIGDPGIRYFYKLIILGKPAAEVSFAINFGVTLLNSVASIFLAVILYTALRAPLKKAGLFFTFEKK